MRIFDLQIYKLSGFLFWWEVILIVAAPMVRMLTALDSRPVTDLLFTKLQLLLGGAVFGGMFILFSVVFTFRAFSEGDDYSGLAAFGKPFQQMQQQE